MKNQKIGSRVFQTPLLVHASDKGLPYPLTNDNSAKLPIEALATSVFDVASMGDTLRMTGRGLNQLTNQSRALVLMTSPPNNEAPIANDKGMTLKLSSGDLKLGLEDSIEWTRLIQPHIATTLCVGGATSLSLSLTHCSSTGRANFRFSIVTSEEGRLQELSVACVDS